MSVRPNTAPPAFKVFRRVAWSWPQHLKRSPPQYVLTCRPLSTHWYVYRANLYSCGGKLWSGLALDSAGCPVLTVLYIRSVSYRC